MKKFILIVFVINLVSCSLEPQSINYSKDICDFCKMTIMDERFSAQCMSTKGKSFKFDDSHCLVAFLKNGGVWRNEVEGIYFSDYSGKKTWIKADQAFLLKSEDLHSPMGGNIAAFLSIEERANASKQFKGELLRWKI